jgi:transaldolase
MKATQKLHELGQSIWLDNITRDLLSSGTLKRYIDELSLTGLTSNPTIFDQAIKSSSAYDSAIRAKLKKGKSGEKLFFELAIEDLAEAADLFRPVWDRTNGVDGWVSLEVSPLLAYDSASTSSAARELHARAQRPNLFIKIPGTKEGLPAIEESIFVGVPVNVTLLFSREQYVAAAEAYLRGIERRIAAGLSPDVGSVASLFISRWDAAVASKVSEPLRNRLGIAIAKRAYKAYRELLGSARSQRIYNEGGRPQRLLWASTGTKDAAASDILYIKALAAPFTVNTMPENTVKAFADHGDVDDILPVDGGDCEEILKQFAKAGVDTDALATQLQEDGAKSFVKSWDELMGVISAKSELLKKAS